MEALAVPARIDVGNAADVLESLRQACGATGAPPALDLAALRDFDSSALSLLLELARERNPAGDTGPAVPAESSVSTVPGRPSAGVPLLLLNPPPKLRVLAELYGVGEMLFGSSAGQPAPAEPA